MKSYLESKDFDIKESCIISAPTNTGKTTALLKYLQETNEMCILVSPLNPLSEQIYNKSNDYFKLINCDNKKESILQDIVDALKNNKPIIISLNTFTSYRNLFYEYKIYIDECHFLIEYHNLIEVEPLIQDIRNKKFKQIIGITATSLYLTELLKLKEKKINLYSNSKKNIFLNTITSYSLQQLLGAIIKLYKENGKLVILFNNTFIADKLSKELNARKINTKLYNSKKKEIQIKEEKFTEDFDIVLCTTSLTTGTSITNEYFSVYIPQMFDTINTIPQFFSRNRNENSKGCILKKSYTDYEWKLNIDTFSNNIYINKTPINSGYAKVFKEYLCVTNMINQDFLNKYLNDGSYTYNYGISYDTEENLLIEQHYVQTIIDQKEYFEKFPIPKFNEKNYPNLSNIYKVHDIVFFGESNDEILNKYVYQSPYYQSRFIFDRGEFYNYFLPFVKRYKTDICINLAKKTSYDSLNIEKFEELFLDKKYNKTEMKNKCIKLFSIKSEIFKNKETINEFLKSLGYCLKNSKSGSIVRKIK